MDKKCYLKPKVTSEESWMEDASGNRYRIISERAFRLSVERDNLILITENENEVSCASRKVEEKEKYFLAFDLNVFPKLKEHLISDDNTNERQSKPKEKQKMKDNPIKKFLDDSMKYCPGELLISELNWKSVLHDVMTGKNLLMVGPSGCGKTLVAQSVAKAFAPENEEDTNYSVTKRKFFDFNLGATQDPRTALIGQMHFNKEKGTNFVPAAFIEAIRTPYAVILLDEVSRAHPDAWNILMTVLDPNQRYVRLDEDPNKPKIKVAEGVCFLGTANIGNEYTSTRIMDHALIERFEILEMIPLDKEGEMKLLKMKYPDVDERIVKSIAEIATTTRDEVKSENPKVTKILSTRSTLSIAEMIDNGFTLAEAAEVRIYPYYDEEGGADSERTYMKQVVQKHIKDPERKKDKDDVFNTDADLLDDKPF